MRLTETQIRGLLDRYEAAETSVAEERELRAALAAPDLPEGLRPYRRWFGGLEVLAKAAPTSRPGPWSVAGGEPLAQPEAPAQAPPPVAVETGAPREAVVRTLATDGASAARRPSRRRALLLRLAAAAAVIGLLALGAGLLLRDGSGSEAPVAESAPPAPSGTVPEALPQLPPPPAPEGPRQDTPTDRRAPATLADAPPSRQPEAPRQRRVTPTEEVPGAPPAEGTRFAVAGPAPIDCSKYEITDPDEAARLTRGALAEVSAHLQRGSALTAVELGRLQPLHHLHNYKS